MDFASSEMKFPKNEGMNIFWDMGYFWEIYFEIWDIAYLPIQLPHN